MGTTLSFNYYKQLQFGAALLLCMTLSIGCEHEVRYVETDLNVLCYNVAGLPAFLSSSKPDLYTTSISPLMNEYDIVHVQEDFCYHDSLRLHNSHQYITETTGCVPGGDGLNSFSNLKIENLDRIPWEHCTFADCLTPKGFSYSQIIMADGASIDFYNVHCNAGSADESLLARRQNIAQLTNYIAEHSEGKAVILMGDFNCRYTRGGDTIRAMFNHSFKDVWVEFVRMGVVPDISEEALRNCSPSRTNPDCEVVDKFFYRSNDNIIITPTHYQLDDPQFYFQNDTMKPLSDHWPIMAGFKIKVEIQ